MVGIVARGETSPLLKAETANSCHLCYWYISLVSLISGTDSGTGVSEADKKTQCTLLSQKFDFQHISLNDVLREKSDDKSYLHAKYLKDCLTKKVNVSTDLAISLLKDKINEGIEKGKKWSLVQGFPNNMRELLEFGEKVSMTHINRILLTSTGTKNELYIASEVLSRANTSAYRKARTIFK